jgi:hypothetical protein
MNQGANPEFSPSLRFIKWIPHADDADNKLNPERTNTGSGTLLL